MNEKEIQEGNELIAQFRKMYVHHHYFNSKIVKGEYWFENPIYEYWEGDKILKESSGIEKKVTGKVEELLYHKSWDWLMSVVEKIEFIKDNYHGRFGVHISSNTCTIQSTNFRPDKRIPDPPHYFDTITLGSKIESTWCAIVRFVKWYKAKEDE
jgi:hypothetical protein